MRNLFAFIIITISFIMMGIAVVTAVLITRQRGSETKLYSISTEINKEIVLTPYVKLGGNTSMVPFEGTDNYLITKKTGQVIVLKDKKSETIFDISKEDKKFQMSFEGGVMCAAFHPKFKENNKVYISYTVDGKTKDNYDTALVINEYILKGNDIKLNREVTRIQYRDKIHHAGTIVFNPIGKEPLLYISSGDGGPQRDPENMAQNPNTLRGKILKINVDKKGSKPEVVALGLRNPWRISFDGKGRMFVANVGLATFESIYLIADINKRYNFGWNYYEGTKQLRPGLSNFTPPIFEYPNSNDTGKAIIGGYYSNGSYKFADFTGIIRAIAPNKGKWEQIAFKEISEKILSMGYNRDPKTKEVDKIFILGTDNILELKLAN